MELSNLIVETQPSLTLPWAETIIMPVGDVQYGAEGCDLDKFQRHIDWGMHMGAYFISMGDMVDVASPSGRKKIQDADFYDSVLAALEEKAYQHLETMANILRGTEGLWLGLHEGHHYWNFGGGKTTDTLLAERLGAPFLGTCAITQLCFRGTHQTCQIWSAHGSGSGAQITSPLNKLERMMSRFPSVDIFLVGHYSRKAGYPVDALVPVFGKNPRLIAKRRILAVTGGFMRGYTVGSRYGGRAQGSYVEKASMPPTNLGAPVIYVRPVYTLDEDRLDMNISL